MTPPGSPEPQDTAAPATTKPAPAIQPRRVIQLTAIFAAVFVIAGAGWWYVALNDVKRAVALYDAGKTGEAAGLLRSVIKSPISAFRLREAAQHALGQCLSVEASRLAEREHSRAGYEKALEILKEARALAGPIKDIETQVRDYTLAINRLDGKAPPPVPKVKTLIPEAPSPSAPPAEKTAPPPQSGTPQTGPT